MMEYPHGYLDLFELICDRGRLNEKHTRKIIRQVNIHFKINFLFFFRAKILYFRSILIDLSRIIFLRIDMVLPEYSSYF